MHLKENHIGTVTYLNLYNTVHMTFDEMQDQTLFRFLRDHIGVSIRRKVDPVVDFPTTDPKIVGSIPGTPRLGTSTGSSRKQTTA